MAQLKFSKKHKIKEDKFIEKVFAAQQWLSEHSRQISTFAIGALVVALVAFFITSSKQSRKQRAKETFGMAMVAMQTGDTTTAIEKFKTIVERSSGSSYGTIGTFMLGSIYYNRKDYALAEEYYKRNVEHHKEYGFLRGAGIKGMGYCAIQRQDYRQAITHFNDFIQAFPEHYLMPEILVALAECHLKENAPSEARLALQRVVDEFSFSTYASNARNILATF